MKTSLKIFTLLLSLCLVLPLLSGCALFGRENLPQKQTVDHVYRYETTELCKTDVRFWRATSASGGSMDGGKDIGATSISPCGYLYILNSYGADYRSTGYEIHTADFAGGAESVIPLDEFSDESQNGWINSALRLEDGVVVLLQTSKLLDADTYQYEEKYELRKYGFDGTLKDTLDLRGVLDIPSSSYFYIDRIITDGKKLYFSYSGEAGRSPLMSLDANFELRTYADFLPVGEDMWVTSFFFLNEGEIACVYETYGAAGASYKMRALDLASGAVRDLSYDVSTYAYNVFGGSGSVYAANENGVIKLAEDGSRAVELDFINSDYIYNYGNFYADASGDFFLMSQSYEDEETTLNFTRFKKVPDSEITPKWLITVASAGNAYSFREQIVKFNLSQDDYRIAYTDYSQYNTDEDYEGGKKALEAELLAGRVPDILIADGSFSAQTYLRKGLFTDLYALMDADGDVHRADFIPGVLSAAETDGKLYELPTNILLSGLVCKTETAKTYGGMTLPEFAAAMKNLPEGVTLFRMGEMRREDMLRLLFEDNYTSFIQPATATASFGGADFAALLEIAAAMPEKYYWDDENFDYENFDWQAYENSFADDKALFSRTFLSSFDEFGGFANMFRTADVSFIGLPSAGRDVAFSAANLKYLISEQCAFKDAAWDFIKIFFADDYQKKQSWGFPVTLSALEEARDAAIENLKNGQQDDPVLYATEEVAATYDTDTKMIAEEPYDGDGFESFRISEEKINELYDLVLGVKKQHITDASVENILVEEASACFAGQKSAADVAGLLDSRVSLYLGEQR